MKGRVYTMTFVLYKASDYKFKDSITFETLEAMRDWAVDLHEEVVIDFDELKITIYDDYLE